MAQIAQLPTIFWAGPLDPREDQVQAAPARHLDTVARRRGRVAAPMS